MRKKKEDEKQDFENEAALRQKQQRGEGMKRKESEQLGKAKAGPSLSWEALLHSTIFFGMVNCGDNCAGSLTGTASLTSRSSAGWEAAEWGS